MDAFLGKKQKRGSFTVAQFHLLQEIFRDSGQALGDDKKDAPAKVTNSKIPAASPGDLGAEATDPAPVPATAATTASSATAASAAAAGSAAAAAPDATAKVVEEIKHKTNRFVPHTGPTVEFLICYRIQPGIKAMSLAELLAMQFKPKIVAHYPTTPASISGKLQFCELEKPLGIFLFGDSMRLRSTTEIDEASEARLMSESGLPGDPAVHSFVLTNSAHVQFNIHCATVHVPVGEDGGAGLIKPGTPGAEPGVGLLEPVSVVLITRQPFYVSLRERLRQLVAEKGSEAADYASEGALKALAEHFPPHVEKPQGHSWVSSFRDRASHSQSMNELQSRFSSQPKGGQSPAAGKSNRSSVFKCLFCGTTADEVYDHTESSCEIVPEESVPALPFDVVVYDLVQLLVRRKDATVECLASYNHISEDQYELLLEKLHADETHANWDDVSSTAVAHLLKRYLETLSDALVPSDLFKSMLHASEANMSAWMLSDEEIKSFETGKPIQNWTQHRVALKSMVGLIFAIAKRSMASTIEEIRARVADDDLPTEDMRKVLSEFSECSRQAASFFASGLLRPAIEDDIIQQKPWERLVNMPSDQTSLGFRSCPRRKKPPSKSTEEEAVAAFISNKEYLEVADSVVKNKNVIKINMARLIAGQRQPLVEDCINFLSQRECLSTTRIGIHKPPAKAVELLYTILVYRQLHDPYYDVLPVFEAAGPHVVLAALVKFLSGLQSFQSKKLISRKVWEERLLSLCPPVNVEPRKSTSALASASKSRVGSFGRVESYRAPLPPSRMTKPAPKDRISAKLRPLPESLSRQQVVKLPVEPEKTEETDPEESEPMLAKDTADEVDTVASTSTYAKPEKLIMPPASMPPASVPKLYHTVSSPAALLRASRSSGTKQRARSYSVPRSSLTSKTLPRAQNARKIATGVMSSTLFTLKPKDMEIDVKILVRKVFTLLAAICDDPDNGVVVQDLVECFVPVLFDAGQSRYKNELEMICETLIVDRIDESKAVIDCVERLITTLCKQPSKGEHSAVKSVDPSTSPLASLIGCLPKSAAARQNMRESLVCPAPYRHFDLPYDTLFRILGPDLIVIFINAILCEVSVIFTSKSRRLIVDVLESALSLMAPYEWQGLYIPLLPERMREGLMGAPFPFIVGWMPSDDVPDIMYGVDLGENAAPRLIFNLDDGSIIGAKKKMMSGFTYYECDPATMPPLSPRHLKRLITLLRRVRDVRDATWGTLAILEGSDEEKIEFFHKSGRQRIKEIRWAVTSVLISLFKNLRQCITESDSSASNGRGTGRVLNHDEFIATFPSERHPHIKQILKTQSFECFLEDHIISGGGNPFDHWCFIKVESLTHRFIRNKRRPQQGLLFKAKVGTETDSWKLRFFKMDRNSQVIEYYEVPKESAAKILSNMPADTSVGENLVDASVLAKFKTYKPPVNTLKGKFTIQEGDSKVIVPKLDTNFASGFLQMFGLKKFKTPFQFQIRNPSNGSSKSLLTCCAMTSDGRRQWITCLKSRIVDDRFLDNLSAVYKERTSHFKDSSTIQRRQQRWGQIYKFYQIDDPAQTGAEAEGDDAV